MTTTGEAVSGESAGEVALLASDPVTILYTNWRGETAVRHIHPSGQVWFGSTDYHRTKEWLLTVDDADKGARRHFALSGIKAWGQEAVDAALAPAPHAEVEMMRAALAECAFFAGAAVSPDCSVEFLCRVPEEVRLVVERMKRERDAALRASPASPDDGWRPTHRHVKRGSDYEKIGSALLQASTGPVGEAAVLVVYRDFHGRLWARPEAEFDDGRFEPLPSPPSAPETEVAS